ncbi:SET domain-containing protein 4-like [Osmerus eperlanus]|uniref:SET domain-containing protein 4-like n=1 Tax=Osmerus eperlanus TaxID=29151 RepID=UPI002E102DF7
MARRSGRRARRKRRKREGVAAVQSVTLSHEPPFVCLRRWLQKRGFSSRLLLPAHFSDTGRGLLSLTALQPGELLISLPESCLLTTSTVLKSYLGQYIKRYTVQVQACFNEVSRCYEVHSLQGCHKFQQAFICYGPHDNQRLLLEYGFVAPDNPHGVVYVEEGLLQKCVCAEGRGQLEQKLLFLKQHDLLQNLTFGVDGPSWRLMTVLRLLSLRPEHYPQWKSVLQGAAVSEETEQLSVLMAAHTCQLLLQDTATILDQISRLREQCDRVLREQLEVVAQLRQEEQGILGSSLDVLRRLQAHSQAE